MRGRYGFGMLDYRTGVKPGNRRKVRDRAGIAYVRDSVLFYAFVNPAGADAGRNAPVSGREADDEGHAKGNEAGSAVNAQGPHLCGPYSRRTGITAMEDS